MIESGGKRTDVQDLKERYWIALEEFAEEEVCKRHMGSKYREQAQSASSSLLPITSSTGVSIVHPSSQRIHFTTTKAMDSQIELSPFVHTLVNVASDLTEIDEIPHLKFQCASNPSSIGETKSKELWTSKSSFQQLHHSRKDGEGIIGIHRVLESKLSNFPSIRTSPKQHLLPVKQESTLSTPSYKSELRSEDIPVETKIRIREQKGKYEDKINFLKSRIREKEEQFDCLKKVKDAQISQLANVVHSRGKPASDKSYTVNVYKVNIFLRDGYGLREENVVPGEELDERERRKILSLSRKCVRMLHDTPSIKNIPKRFEVELKAERKTFFAKLRELWNQILEKEEEIYALRKSKNDQISHLVQILKSKIQYDANVKWQSDSLSETDGRI